MVDLGVCASRPHLLTINCTHNHNPHKNQYKVIYQFLKAICSCLVSNRRRPPRRLPRRTGLTGWELFLLFPFMWCLGFTLTVEGIMILDGFEKGEDQELLVKVVISMAIGSFSLLVLNHIQVCACVQTCMCVRCNCWL